MRAGGCRIALQVVQAMGMHLVQLGRRLTRRPVSPAALSPLKLVRRTAHPHEHHAVVRQNIQAVEQPPVLAENVIHDDVVACRRHARDCAVKAGPVRVRTAASPAGSSSLVFCLARMALMVSTAMEKCGGSSISSSCSAMLDFPELEVPFRKVIWPRRPSGLLTDSSCQALLMAAAARAC
jgi:hypothetical protein